MVLENLGKQGNIQRDKRYKFQILGQGIIIKTEKDEDYVYSLINFIERKAKSITEASFLKKVLLLLLDITDELFIEREKRKKTEKYIEKKIDFLTSLIPE